mmetsp:Transcript_25456/g.58131  ORF Transcript_25456/g.58131 Transcript_25456/m.58131 type:complete len:322 (-) Transcript_25456:29-994(-)
MTRASPSLGLVLLIPMQFIVSLSGASRADIPIIRAPFFNSETHDGSTPGPRPHRRRRRRRSGTRDAEINDPPMFGGEDVIENADPLNLHKDSRPLRYTSIKRRHVPAPFDNFVKWIHDKSGIEIPRISVGFDPITTLKLRKSWENILPWAIIRLGADLETHRLGRGAWKLRGCLEDKIIGGRFSLNERYNRDTDQRALLVGYSKSWFIANDYGAGSGTRLNISADYDVKTRRGGIRMGFQQESVWQSYLLPGRRRGVSIVPTLPLDVDRRVQLEVKSNIELPAPEFGLGVSMSLDSDAPVELDIGVGDVNVDIEELYSSHN